MLNKLSILSLLSITSQLILLLLTGYSITFKKGVGITSVIQEGFVYYYNKLIKTDLK